MLCSILLHFLKSREETGDTEVAGHNITLFSTGPDQAEPVRCHDTVTH